jgi:UDP-3-O-[3-hydroxymyristoyl] glucosamine N-acyltransferase
MESNVHRWTLGELAVALGGELRGPAEMPIDGPAPADSDDPRGIGFCESEEYLDLAKGSRVGALILPRTLTIEKPHLLVDHPRTAFGRLLAMAQRPLPLREGVHPTAVVSDTALVDPSASVGPYAVVEAGAKIAAGARIFPFCYVGENCEVGEETVLYPNVVLYQDVRVGARSIVHSGVVMGGDGFGFGWDGKSRVKIPQVGGVVIGDEVEIGAGTTVDRATAGDTVLGNGTKLDNLVQIGHNVRVGESCAIAAQTGIGGSCRIGNRVVMGGQSAMSDHAAVGDDITFGGRTGTSQDLMEPGIYFGTPARPIQEAMRSYLLVPKLPELMSRLRKLEKRLAELESKEN